MQDLPDVSAEYLLEVLEAFKADHLSDVNCENFRVEAFLEKLVELGFVELIPFKGLFLVV